ncbi:MAG: GNAT family N-acetyltransferase [SAR202 cluster bacterium]|nr:GNAT family N-acetyltransferase [SAR202 cluster bacterium]
MIRPTIPSDTATLVTMAGDTGVFKPLEIQALQEVLDDFHSQANKEGHRSITYEQDGHLAGFAYFAPAAMTDRTWYLWWIVVNKQIQARGIGGKLLSRVEEEIRHSGGRLLLIETSSLPHYDLTRRFYLKHGYKQATVLHDFYADGDDLVVYSKRITN